MSFPDRIGKLECDVRVLENSVNGLKDQITSLRTETTNHINGLRSDMRSDIRLLAVLMCSGFVVQATFTWNSTKDMASKEQMELAFKSVSPEIALKLAESAPPTIVK